MKTLRFLPVGLILLLAMMAPFESPAAPAAGKQLPSVRLRQLIDTTLPRINSLVGKQQPPNRAALAETHAEWSALAQTAPAAQQPLYAAAANVAQILLGAVDEHEKAVADFHYSKGVHGAQDKKDAEISNPTRGWDAGALARADNAKQNKENADSRKALLQKEEFMNRAVMEQWKVRSEQIGTAVEQAYTAELVAEKQTTVAQAPTPAPAPPKPKPASSAADQYSPVGTWSTHNNKQWILKEDGSLTTPFGAGKWHAGDPGKHELVLTLPNGRDATGTFSADGKSLQVALPNGNQVPLTR